MTDRPQLPPMENFSKENADFPKASVGASSSPSPIGVPPTISSTATPSCAAGSFTAGPSAAANTGSTTDPGLSITSSSAAKKRKLDAATPAEEKTTVAPSLRSAGLSLSDSHDPDPVAFYEAKEVRDPIQRRRVGKFSTEGCRLSRGGGLSIVEGACTRSRTTSLPARIPPWA